MTYFVTHIVPMDAGASGFGLSASRSSGQGLSDGLPALSPITSLPHLSPLASPPLLTSPSHESLMTGAGSQGHIDLTCPALFGLSDRSPTLTRTPSSVESPASRLSNGGVLVSSPSAFFPGSPFRFAISPVQGLLTEGSQEGQSGARLAPGSTENSSGLAAADGLSAMLSAASVTPAAGMFVCLSVSTCVCPAVCLTSPFFTCLSICYLSVRLSSVCLSRLCVIGMLGCCAPSGAAPASSLVALQQMGSTSPALSLTPWRLTTTVHASPVAEGPGVMAITPAWMVLTTPRDYITPTISGSIAERKQRDSPVGQQDDAASSMGSFGQVTSC